MKNTNDRRGHERLVRRLTTWTAQGTQQFADYGPPTWCCNVDMPGGHSIEKHVQYCEACRGRLPELVAARDAREKHNAELRGEYERNRQAALRGAAR